MNTTPDEGMRKFESALRQILTVSKSDLDRIRAKQRALNADKPKRGPKIGSHRSLSRNEAEAK